MKNEKRIIALIWAFAVLPLIVSSVVFGRLPEQIPMHWNINGEVDSWYPKFPGAFILPLVAAAVAVLVTVLPKLDPKGKNYEKFKPQYFIIRLVLVIFFNIIHVITISISMGADFLRIDTIMKFLMGILFIVLGNAMPKLKQNYFVGIKTPWTIQDEAVWVKTHRHGGFVWFIIGIAMSGLALVPGKVSGGLFIALILVSAVEPIVYSWIRYTKRQ